MILSGQFPNLPVILSMSTLTASFWKFRSKLNKLWRWQCLSEAFAATLRLMIQSGKILKLSEILSIPTLSASFRKIWLKLNEFCWKSNRGVFSNQGDITLSFIIRSSSVRLFSRFLPCLPYLLQVSGTSDQNWMSYADEKVKPRLFFSNQGVVTKINSPI